MDQDHEDLYVLSLCGLILNILDLNIDACFLLQKCDDLGMNEV